MSMQAFSLVCAGYEGTFLGTTRDSCSNCHRDTLKAARAFDRFRGWYGRVRGSDEILSWHPVSPASVSRNGFTFWPALRREFVEAGIVERYEPTRHPAGRYTILDTER
jgi:hypothetical protein